MTSEVAFGLARMYQLTLKWGPEALGVFRQMEDALAWVGLDLATQWPAGPPDSVFIDSPPG